MNVLTHSMSHHECPGASDEGIPQEGSGYNGPSLMSLTRDDVHSQRVSEQTSDGGSFHLHVVAFDSKFHSCRYRSPTRTSFRLETLLFNRVFAMY